MNAYKIEHIGIAVKSLARAIPLYEKLLDTPCYKTEEIPTEKVVTAFFDKGASKIELLEDNGGNGVIQKFIDQKGEGMHHIAFAVTDILSEMKRLEEAGFALLSQEPKRGADNKLVCFLHPKHTTGVLIELCQDIK